MYHPATLILSKLQVLSQRAKYIAGEQWHSVHLAANLSEAHTHWIYKICFIDQANRETARKVFEPVERCRHRKV